MSDLEERVLTALRRITRAIDIHSRHLANNFGMTGPQLVCLRTIGQRGPLTSSELARHVALSQATLTGIIDRLAARQLVRRTRSSQDRRFVRVAITAAGRALLAEAPSALQETFVRGLRELPVAARENVCGTLEQIVAMMGGEELLAEPVLTEHPSAPEDIVEHVAAERVAIEPRPRRD